MPHAEISEVWPRDGRIRVTGDLVDTAADGDWRLELRCGAPPPVLPLRRAVSRVLSGPHRQRYPAVVAGTMFAAGFPVRDLAAPRPRADWELYLVDGSRELRLGRHLDDVADKSEIFVYPAQKARGVQIRPVFTPSNLLAVRCRRVGRS